MYERECDFVASPPTGRVVLALGPNSAKNPFPRRHIESLASRLFLTCPDPADGRLLATGREEARTQNEVKEGKGNTSRGRVRETRDTSLLLKEKRWKKKATFLWPGHLSSSLTLSRHQSISTTAEEDTSSLHQRSGLRTLRECRRNPKTAGQTCRQVRWSTREGGGTGEGGHFKRPVDTRRLALTADRLNVATGRTPFHAGATQKSATAAIIEPTKSPQLRKQRQGLQNQHFAARRAIQSRSAVLANRSSHKSGECMCILLSVTALVARGFRLVTA